MYKNCKLDKVSIGQRIQSLRNEKNLSQDELAEKLGYQNRQSITKWETGTTPTTEALAKLSEFFGVSTDYILGFTKYSHFENEFISEVTTLSDKSIEVLRKNKEKGHNRYLFMLDLILSDEEVFNGVMKNLNDLVFPPVVVVNDVLIKRKYLTQEDLETLSTTPDQVFHNIREILSEFAKKNKDKPIISDNAYHPDIYYEKEVVEYGKH